MDARTPIESAGSHVALSAAFNLNCDCFAVATNSGFRVFDAATCKQLAQRQLHDGGVGLIQLFGRSNVIPLVGGSLRPVSGPTKVVIWDEKQTAFTREIVCPSRVRALRVLDRRLVIVLQEEVRVYSIASVPHLDTRYPTAANHGGLCSIARTHMAFPGRTPGQVQVIHSQTQSVTIIPAHTSALRAVALSRDGSLLATASEKGTLIRVWSTASSGRLAELRRGVDQVAIFALGFNPSGTLLACTSDKGTLHIFDVPHFSNTYDGALYGGAVSSDAGGDWSYEESDVGSYVSDARTEHNCSSDGVGRWGVLGKLPFMPQYFRDVVSFASAEFALDDGAGSSWQREAQEAATMCWSRLPRGLLGWTNDNTVVVLGTGIDAKYERFVITTSSDGRRTCVRQAWANYMGID